MKRSEYMNQLSEALNVFGEDIKSEIMEDYEEHYEIGLQNGKNEDQISEELGDIEELVRELKKSDMTDSKRQEQTVKLEKVNETQESINSLAAINLEKKQDSQEQEKTIEANAPRKVEVRSKFARVEVMTSIDGQIHLEWVNYSESRAKDFYEFRSWMDGTVIYGELCKKSMAGLFVPMFNGDVLIKVQIPSGFPEIWIRSLSGDTVMRDTDVLSAKLQSASGDILVECCSAGQMSLDTKSGTIICKDSRGANYYMDTKSGNISYSNIQCVTMQAHSFSGHVQANNLIGDCHVTTASGNIQVAACTSKQFDLYSMSGKLDIRHVQSENMKLDTKSGSIRGEMCVGCLTASSISGNVTITNAREGSFTLSAVSGDIDFICNNITGYVAEVHSVSGKNNLSFRDCSDRKLRNGVYTYGTGSSRIKVKTTSGNIDIRA